MGHGYCFLPLMKAVCILFYISPARGALVKEPGTLRVILAREIIFTGLLKVCEGCGDLSTAAFLFIGQEDYKAAWLFPLKCL